MTFFTDAVTVVEGALNGYGWLVIFFPPHPLSLTVRAVVVHIALAVQHKVNFTHALKCPLTILHEHTSKPHHASSGSYAYGENYNVLQTLQTAYRYHINHRVKHLGET